MNKEMLEKMQWLYEQGFKPDLYYKKYSFPIGKFSLEPNSNKGTNAQLIQKEYPYFTESRLWSLLKKTLFIFKLSTALKIDPDELLIEALLNKTICAVKEGHLKAEVK
jgi:hypothetical protein